MKLRDEMLTDIAAHLAKNKMLTVEDRAEVLARLAVTPIAHLVDIWDWFQNGGMFQLVLARAYQNQQTALQAAQEAAKGAGEAVGTA